MMVIIYQTNTIHNDNFRLRQVSNNIAAMVLNYKRSLVPNEVNNEISETKPFQALKKGWSSRKTLS